jgi:hypothetical protein
MPAGDVRVKYRSAIDTMFRRYYGPRGALHVCERMWLVHPTSAMRLAFRAPGDGSAELFGWVIRWKCIKSATFSQRPER